MLVVVGSLRRLGFDLKLCQSEMSSFYTQDRSRGEQAGSMRRWFGGALGVMISIDRWPGHLRITQSIADAATGDILLFYPFSRFN